MNTSVLLIEDNVEIHAFIRDLLTRNNYIVTSAHDGAKGLDLFRKSQPDIVLLDLGLPGLSGETVCAEIKRDFPEIPVIILSAKSQTSDVLRGFKLGAQDYMPKPFVGEELLARIKARLEPINKTGNKLTADDLTLDTKTFTAERGGRKISLSQKEYELLEYLMINKGRVLTRDMILNRVWLYSPDIESRVVDVYIGYLRKKIDEGFDKKLIESRRGFGYSIRSDEDGN